MGREEGGVAPVDREENEEEVLSIRFGKEREVDDLRDEDESDLERVLWEVLDELGKEDGEEKL